MSASQEVGEIFGEGAGPATALLRSPTVIIASIGLWGMNLYFFRLFGIDYKHALMHGTNLTPYDNDLESPSVKNRSSHGNTLRGTDDSALDLGRPTTPLGKIQTAPISMPIRLDASSSTNTSPAVHRGSKNSPQSPIVPGSDSKPGVKRLDSGHVDNLSGYQDFTASRLLGLSAFLMALLHTTTFVWIHLLGGDAIGAIFAFYTTCAIMLLIPYKSTKWVRRGVTLVFRRLLELVNPRCYCCIQSDEPPKPVPFLDVFFADAMCSMSKVFFDWGMLWHLASHYPDPVPNELHSIFIPSCCAAWPYLVRARQCLVMNTVGLYKHDPKRYQHVLNAIKYSTSLFPIIVSAYQKTIIGHPFFSQFLEFFLVVLLVVNSLYSFAWDVMMDWGMLTDPYSLLTTPDKHSPQTFQHKCLRPRLRFGLKLSLSILLINFILRFAWLLRFRESDLFNSVDEFVLCSQFLEVVRRALWNLLRVEWENIKITSAADNESSNTLYDNNLSNSISMVPLQPSQSNGQTLPIVSSAPIHR